MGWQEVAVAVSLLIRVHKNQILIGREPHLKVSVIVGRQMPHCSL